MLLVVNGVVTQAYYAEKTGITYFTVGDSDTMTVLELTSNRLAPNEVKSIVDQKGRIEVTVKVTKFQSADRFEALAFRFTSVAAEAGKASVPNGAKQPA